MKFELKDISHFSEFRSKAGPFRYMDNGHAIEGVYSKSDSESLVIFLQGAVDREKIHPPVFHRWSWAKEINANVLTLNDPLLYRDKGLRIGWYIGAFNFDYIQKIGHFLRCFVRELGLDKRKIIFFSSSAGGYAAMALATQIKNGLAIVNNPQTNVLNYYEGHVRDFLEVGFNGIGSHDISQDIMYRFCLIERFRKFSYVPEIKYYQNTADKFHFTNHFLPFVEKLGELRLPTQVEIKIYTDDDAGHSPLSKEDSVSIINSELLV